MTKINSMVDCSGNPITLFEGVNYNLITAGKTLYSGQCQIGIGQPDSSNQNVDSWYFKFSGNTNGNGKFYYLQSREPDNGLNTINYVHSSYENADVKFTDETDNGTSWCLEPMGLGTYRLMNENSIGHANKVYFSYGANDLATTEESGAIWGIDPAKSTFAQMVGCNGNPINLFENAIYNLNTDGKTLYSGANQIGIGQPDSSNQNVDSWYFKFSGNQNYYYMISKEGVTGIIDGNYGYHNYLNYDRIPDSILGQAGWDARHYRVEFTTEGKDGTSWCFNDLGNGWYTIQNENGNSVAGKDLNQLSYGTTNNAIITDNGAHWQVKPAYYKLSSTILNTQYNQTASEYYSHAMQYDKNSLKNSATEDSTYVNNCDVASGGSTNTQSLTLSVTHTFSLTYTKGFSKTVSVGAALDLSDIAPVTLKGGLSFTANEGVSKTQTKSVTYTSESSDALSMPAGYEGKLKLYYQYVEGYVCKLTSDAKVSAISNGQIIDNPALVQLLFDDSGSNVKIEGCDDSAKDNYYVTIEGLLGSFAGAGQFAVDNDNHKCEGDS